MEATFGFGAPPPADTDGDGVIDRRDRCPDTPRGADAGSREVLDRVATSLREWSGVRVEIGGHTDSQGAESYNLDLSRRRAESVRDYLVKKGVDGGRLAVKG